MLHRWQSNPYGKQYAFQIGDPVEARKQGAPPVRGLVCAMRIQSDRPVKYCVLGRWFFEHELQCTEQFDPCADDRD